MLDYEDSEVDARWCSERRAEVVAYLHAEGLRHGGIGDCPAWHLAPFVSIWAVQSLAKPGRVGWWAICGDLPCDYVSSKDAEHPREAMRAIAMRWADAAARMLRGDQLPHYSIGPPEESASLAPMLHARAELLTDMASDESLWEEDAL
ncbi:DUF4826 family protein [Methylibium rhizosphaerae]|uniref:DUF4826 family protein n=1 Tax=Methylibium rhizosphaerae TaxID=2570323 RepID=UPI0011290B2B